MKPIELIHSAFVKYLKVPMSVTFEYDPNLIYNFDRVFTNEIHKNSNKWHYVKLTFILCIEVYQIEGIVDIHKIV